MKFVVIDDDPTGSQTVHDCLLLLRWDCSTLAKGFESKSNLFFILANTRSLSENDAKLRIEAGLILFGNEFDGQQDPFEAGIGFAVPLKTKEEDYIGKEVLKERKANPQKKLVGLELIGKEHAGHGDCVHVGRSQVGVITSACLSTTLNKNIALCRIDAHYSELGTEVEVGKIDGHQKRISAKVVRFPFYDPDKTKVRS